jgi:hypothetical protein
LSADTLFDFDQAAPRAAGPALRALTYNLALGFQGCEQDCAASSGAGRFR